MSKRESSQATSTGNLVVPVERLTRLKQTISGQIAPTELPDLAEYLASYAGRIDYRFTGNTLTDQSARRKQQIKCIILGWFEVADAVTLLPSRFEVNIDSLLVIVSSEDELPPLEDESDEEDYIVCNANFDVIARLQEEILLVLPLMTPRGIGVAKGKQKRSGRQNEVSHSQVGLVNEDSEAQVSRSPFAKLAALKKTS